MYKLELARLEDLPACIEILSSGRSFQRQQGFVQWPDGFPKEETIRGDILSGNGYVLRQETSIAAYLYIGYDGDPCYSAIDGTWLNDAPYAVIHRIAIGSDFRGKGFADVIFALAEEMCRNQGVQNLRIDTHADNLPMQAAIQRAGFQRCGTIYIADGSARIAYDRI